MPDPASVSTRPEQGRASRGVISLGGVDGDTGGAPEVVAPIDAGRRSAERALNRLVLVGVPLWLVAIVPGELTGAGPRPEVIAGAAIVVLGYLAFRRHQRAGLLLLPMLLCLYGLVWASPSGVPSGDVPWIPWLNLACLVIGVLVSPALVAAGLGTATALSAVGLAAMGLSGGLVVGQGGWTLELAAIAALACTNCLVAAGCADVLRDTSRRADLAAARRAREAARVAGLRAGQSEVVRVARLLHDTVVNTLGAVARWPGLDPQDVAERSRADLALLDTIDRPSGGDPQQLLDNVSRRAKLLGLSLRLDVQRLGPDLDPEVADALAGSGREVLTNVTKHAGVASAQLTWWWDGASGRMAISDGGVGFDSTGGWTGGAAQSVVARCADVGVAVGVSSGPASGTQVELTWSATHVPTPSSPDEGRDQDVMGEVSSVLARALLRIVLVVGGLGLLALAVTPAGWPSVGSVATLGLLGGLGLLALAVRDGRLEASRAWWALYPLGAILCTALPNVRLAGCQQVGVLWWGGIAGLAFASAAPLLDRRAWVVALTGAGHVIGGAVAAYQVGPGARACLGPAWTNLLTDLAALAAMWALARRLERTWGIGRTEQQSMISELARQAQIEQASRIRQGIFQFARTVAEPLMVGLAERRLDPRDAEVRARCARAESTLRALTWVPIADPSSSGRALARLVIQAHEADVRLSLSLDRSAMPASSCRERCVELLAALLPACTAGGTLRLTTLPGQQTITMVALIGVPADAGQSILTGSGWTVSRSDGDLLAEVELPRAVGVAPDPQSTGQ